MELVRIRWQRHRSLPLLETESWMSSPWPVTLLNELPQITSILLIQFTPLDERRWRSVQELWILFNWDMVYCLRWLKKCSKVSVICFPFFFLLLQTYNFILSTKNTYIKFTLRLPNKCFKIITKVLYIYTASVA